LLDYAERTAERNVKIATWVCNFVYRVVCYSQLSDLYGERSSVFGHAAVVSTAKGHFPRCEGGPELVPS